MRMLRTRDTHLDWRHGYVSLGNFDGVHRGHQAMLARLRQHADAANAPAVAVTFDPHPSVLLRPDAAPPLITTLAERAALLADYGADFVLALPVDADFLQLSAERFFHDIVEGTLAAKGLVEGPNFFFGHNRGGNVTLLKHYCHAAGLTLDVVLPVTVDEQLVSSSVIRSLIEDGDLDDAVELLGHPYRLAGMVTTGAQRGRSLGFPTANLGEIPTVIPGHGVYGGVAKVEGQRFAAAVNIGPNPTFGENAAKVEVHLIDYQGDLYDRSLAVDLEFRVRDVQKFESVEALKTQLGHDIEMIRARISSISQNM